MRIRLGRLRRLISEQLDQMKLGVASAYPPPEAWGREDEPESEPFEPEEGGPTYIATTPPVDYTPDDETLQRWRDWRLEQEKRGMYEPWEPEDEYIEVEPDEVELIDEPAPQRKA